MPHSEKRNKLLFFLGVICVLAWLASFIDAMLSQRPSWLLWYSSTGLLLTGIALIREDVTLISSLFCALFVFELLWGVDFLSHLFFNTKTVGMASYAFTPGFGKKNFYISLYHLLIPISLFIGVLKIPKIYKHAWLGASIFVTVLMTLTLLLVNSTDSINCLYPVAHCKAILPILYSFSPVSRIVIGIVGAIIVVYIPSQFLAMWLNNRFQNHLQSSL